MVKCPKPLTFVNAAGADRGMNIDMFDNILVPTDGTGLADSAIREAAALARELGSKLVLFYAPPMAGLSPPIRPNEREMVRKALAEEAQQVLSTAAARDELAGLPVERHYAASSSPAEAIIDAADAYGCDLIIMASHKRRGMSAVLHASETRRVLRDSKVPVIVVQ